MNLVSPPFTGNVLVIGALGQIGQELTEALRTRYGASRVIPADIRLPVPAIPGFISLNVLDRDALRDVVRQYDIRVIYNLAAILSARGEQDPVGAWQINMDGLMNTLEVMRETGIRQLFWPSSIAVFGHSSPRDETPQACVMEPATVYGISKLAGERWCDYYTTRYGLDVRSLRYPGLIGYKSLPGGGTTDYAVDIFHQAILQGQYQVYLREDTRLPMMYMPDAMRATIALMEAPQEQLSTRSAYNLAGVSFTPGEIAAEIQKHIPGFTCSYAPDFRQAIADGWPRSIDDSVAREDWHWQPAFTLETMVADMLQHVQAWYQAAHV
ncbi:MAG: NAD-dependent epimerase/dehydratase family protein [Bacteroidia bacterium]|nr:NAD-dependent epimerase/dehydratase family protein [Bacteroidia bacterium]